MEHRLKSFTLTDVEADEDGGTLTAYASTFDRDPDSYGDIVAKGAFADTLSEWKESGNPIPLLFGHRADDPFMNIGGVTNAVEDDKGLRITATFDPDNPNAQYSRKLVREGRLTKMSFAFDVLDEGPVELSDGVKANELRRIDLFEVSLVPIPANQHAEVLDVKSRKSGRTLSKSTESSLRAAASQLETARAAIDDATSALAAVLSAVDPPSGGSDAETDANDPDNAEEPGKANAEAEDARRDVGEYIKQFIKKGQTA